MRTLKLVVQYDGTDYVGWQRQAAGTSIQGLLEEALRPIEGDDVTVHGAGRTDAGVHARGQVASVRLTASIEADTLARALNAVLPLDVRIAAVEVVPDDFHARFSATGKVYDYQVINGPFASPFWRRYVWHVIPSLDLDAMVEASAALIGVSDDPPPRDHLRVNDAIHRAAMRPLDPDRLEPAGHSGFSIISTRSPYSVSRSSRPVNPMRSWKARDTSLRGRTLTSQVSRAAPMPRA